MGRSELIEVTKPAKRAAAWQTDDEIAFVDRVINGVAQDLGRKQAKERAAKLLTSYTTRRFDPAVDREAVLNHLRALAGV